MSRTWVTSLISRILGVEVLAASLVGCAGVDCVVPVSYRGAVDQTRQRLTYSPALAAQRDPRAFGALPEIQSHAARHASIHQGKGGRRWHSDHHHQAKHVKAGLKTPYGGQHPNEVKEQIDMVQHQVTATGATASDKSIQLKPGPGRDKVEAHCGACHSLDYVIMNSPFLNASGWDAEVAKMINAFGASIDQSDAEIIADYLKKNYGM